MDAGTGTGLPGAKIEIRCFTRDVGYAHANPPLSVDVQRQVGFTLQYGVPLSLDLQVR